MGRYERTDVRDFPRQAPLSFPCNGAWYMPKERPNTADAVYSTIDFLVILDGEGFAAEGVETWKIVGPAVCLILPGIRHRHWSVDGWEIFWTGYDAKHRGVFDALRAEIGAPVWQLKTPREAQRLVREIREFCRQEKTSGFADRLDRLCAALVTECVLGREGPKRVENEFHKILEWVDRHYLENLSVEKIARKFGMSRSAFFQSWKRHMTLSPGHYIMDARIAKAREYLEQTEDRIQEIADRLNFADPLYFSRKFRQVTGESPRQYRAGRRR